MRIAAAIDSPQVRMIHRKSWAQVAGYRLHITPLKAQRDAV
jgi:hypothetical protein